MIFIGTVNLTRTRDEGNFLCPCVRSFTGLPTKGNKSMADDLFYSYDPCR